MVEVYKRFRWKYSMHLLIYSRVEAFCLAMFFRGTMPTKVNSGADLQVAPNPRRPTFLQRSASVASLVAWKARFESYSGRFTKKPSFVSYTSTQTIDETEREENFENLKYGLAKGVSMDDEGYYSGPETPPPQHLDEVMENPFFKQDFTALENYLKKRLSIEKRKGSKLGQTVEDTREKVFQLLRDLPEGSNLEEFLEAYGIPTEGVNLQDMKEHLKVFIREQLAFEREIEINTDDEGIDDRDSVTDKGSKWEGQIKHMKDLAEGDNLERWLESLDVPYFRSIPETKKEIQNYLSKLQPEPPPEIDLTSDPPSAIDMASLVPQWKELLEKLRNLKSEDELDKWIESLEVPCNVSKAKLKADIKKFFMHEEFENFAGKSIVFKEDTLAKKMWEKFEDSSVLKQVALVAGTTAVMGLVAVLSTTLLAYTIPAGAAFAVVPFFTEVFAQYFLQRQEIAFNLFNSHAQNAKPLSTAWAKQYIMYKYC